MDRSIYSSTGLYIKFRNKNIIERVAVDNLDITELEPIDYRNELIALYDYELPKLCENYTVDSAYDFAEEILEKNIVLGVLLKADINKYLIHRKLADIYSPEELKSKLETVSIRMKLLPYMKNKVNKLFMCVMHKDILAGVLDISMHDAIEYKVTKTRSGDEVLFFDSPESYYEYLIFTFYLRDETVCECELCNRIFVPKTKKKTLYCDRVFKNGKTCKQIGPTQKYKTIAENDIVLKTFEKEKNKMYKRMERNYNFGETPKSITNDDYNVWLSNAVNAKNLYLNNELSQNEALEIIKTN
ncbi:MAG: DUF6076 domain-containing protein [Acetobacter sp.]|nr:DUF6076 domain-containing protein [Bacteroides sp.]MCM1340648.1 DUF6076 domain-containing protein [Acetobacter sp.]MCM1433759.1 DUF6076 domain-containing protein [Clostridiales bacterium]